MDLELETEGAVRIDTCTSTDEIESILTFDGRVLALEPVRILNEKARTAVFVHGFV